MWLLSSQSLVCPVCLFLLSQNLLHPVQPTASSACAVLCPIGWWNSHFTFGDEDASFLPHSFIVPATEICVMWTIQYHRWMEDEPKYKEVYIGCCTGYLPFMQQPAEKPLLHCYIISENSVYMRITGYLSHDDIIIHQTICHQCPTLDTTVYNAHHCLYSALLCIDL